jgi:hypothetical protein
MAKLLLHRDAIAPPLRQFRVLARYLCHDCPSTNTAPPFLSAVSLSNPSGRLTPWAGIEICSLLSVFTVNRDGKGEDGSVPFVNLSVRGGDRACETGCWALSTGTLEYGTWVK